MERRLDESVFFSRPTPAAIGILSVGILLRLLFLPRAAGLDFHVWDLTAATALRGVDPYTSPPLPIHAVGPYAYFPLYLYILMPLKWLSLHLLLPFTVFGKLPVLVGDLGLALVLGAELRRLGVHEAGAAVGMGLFFLNPLVLYNGAFYGRFDSLCLLFLLLSWRALAQERRWSFSFLFGLAVALKTFPLFLLPYLWRRLGRRSILPTAVALGVPLLTAIPFLFHDAGRFFSLVFLYDSSKGPRQFSWQFLLLHLGLDERGATIVSLLLLVLFAGGLFALARRETAPHRYGALAFTLFLLLSKVVYEQYFLWPLPFLIVLLVRDRVKGSALLLGTLSTVGLLANAWIHPFGYRPAPALWLNIGLAILLVVGLWRLAAMNGCSGRASRADDSPA